MTEPRREPFLSPEQWRMVEPLLDAALALPVEQRAAFVDEACSDSAMRNELLRMLAACEQLETSDSLVDQPAAERFASLWEEPEEVVSLAAALADRYTLEGEAGRGGMAVVYRARDLRHQRRVAFKVLRTALTDQGAARFRREIALAANLQHPHILPVFDSGESAGRLWYTMPFVDGESLGARLRREQRLDIPEVVRLLRELAGALDYAHTRGVIHRDLKPDNVLLSGGHAVIADFGVAKALAAATIEGEHDDGRTTVGVSIGTPAYMSPEQAVGDPAIDDRADLYALGVIAYQMLAGVLPFAGTSRQLLFAAHLAQQPAPLSMHRSNVAPGLERLIMRLLEKRPADRPHSAASILAELDALNVSIRHTTDSAVVASAASRPAAVADTASQPAAVAHTASRARPQLYWLLAVVLTAVVTGVTVWAVRTPLPSVRRVLVVPFENVSGDRAIAQFGRVASDAIAQALSTRDFIEVASDAVQPSSATATGHAAAGKASGAGLVVSGSYYIIGDSIQAQLRVTDVASGALLPGSSLVSAHRSTPLVLLEPLANQVLAILTPRLDPRIAEWKMGALPANLEAYNAFLDGLDQMAQGNGLAAIAHWKRAIALDSTYMQPHLNSAAALSGADMLAAADSHLIEVEKRRATLTEGDRAWLDWARASIDGDLSRLVEKAQALVKAEPGAQLPQFFLGIAATTVNRPKVALEAAKGVNYTSGRFRLSWSASIYFRMVNEAYHQLGDHRDELEQARIARGLHPDNRDVLSLELRALAALGRIADMQPLLDQLEAMKPAPNGRSVPSLLVLIAAELQHHRHPADAERVLQRALAWQQARSVEEPQTILARDELAHVLYFLGRHEEAEPLFESLTREQPNNPFYLAHYAANASRLGKSSVADAAAARLHALRLPYDRGHVAYAQAQLAAQRMDATAAITTLERSLRKWIPIGGTSPHTDLMLSPLWGTTRYQELTRPSQ